MSLAVLVRPWGCTPSPSSSPRSSLVAAPWPPLSSPHILPGPPASRGLGGFQAGGNPCHPHAPASASREGFPRGDARIVTGPLLVFSLRGITFNWKEKRKHHLCLRTFQFPDGVTWALVVGCVVSHGWAAGTQPPAFGAWRLGRCRWEQWVEWASKGGALRGHVGSPPAGCQLRLWWVRSVMGPSSAGQRT